VFDEYLHDPGWDEKQGIPTRYFILLIIFMVREIKRLELQK